MEVVGSVYGIGVRAANSVCLFAPAIRSLSMDLPLRDLGRVCTRNILQHFSEAELIERFEIVWQPVPGNNAIARASAYPAVNVIAD